MNNVYRVVGEYVCKFMEVHGEKGKICGMGGDCVKAFREGDPQSGPDFYK